MPTLVTVDDDVMCSDPPRRTGAGKRLYDFRSWFGKPADDDGRVRFVLSRWVHYECSQSAMVQQLRIAATHCGVRLSAVDLDDRVSVCVTQK